MSQSVLAALVLAVSWGALVVWGLVVSAFEEEPDSEEARRRSGRDRLSR